MEKKGKKKKKEERKKEALSCFVCKKIYITNLGLALMWMDHSLDRNVISFLNWKGKGMRGEKYKGNSHLAIV